MKLLPEQKLDVCQQCVFNGYNVCKHPSFESVMYIPLDERAMNFPSWRPLEDTE